jgi:type IV secretory pathway TraG/TraD family ATPase VirD4
MTVKNKKFLTVEIIKMISTLTYSRIQLTISFLLLTGIVFVILMNEISRDVYDQPTIYMIYISLTYATLTYVWSFLDKDTYGDFSHGFIALSFMPILNFVAIIGLLGFTFLGLLFTFNDFIKLKFVKTETM